MKEPAVVTTVPDGAVPWSLTMSKSIYRWKLQDRPSERDGGQTELATYRSVIDHAQPRVELRKLSNLLLAKYLNEHWRTRLVYNQIYLPNACRKLQYWQRVSDTGF